MALDRQAQAGHRRDPRRAAGHRHADLAGADLAARGLDAGHLAVGVAGKAGDFAVLDDVDAERARPHGHSPRPRRHAAPCRRAAAAARPGSGKRALSKFRNGIIFLTAASVEQFGVDAVDAHGVAAPRIGVALGVGMVEVDDAALADHRVVVEVLLHALPQLHRQLVEAGIAGKHVVGADDGGVAAGIAGADPALFQHRDIADAVFAGEEIGGGQAMAAAADDHHVVAILRCWRRARCAASSCGRKAPPGRARRSSIS